MKRILFALLLLTLSPAARAQSGSDQNYALELRVGMYQPSIDGEFSDGTSPFKDIFGGDTAWMFGGELDYQFFHGFGSLGAFAMLHYGRLSGNGLEASGEQSSDSTKMIMLPVIGGVAYRFDVLASRWSIPLVPVFKVGLNHTFWWIKDGLGDVSSYQAEGQDAVAGKGGTFGLYASVGLHLLLDVFEPHTTKTFDNELGVNHSYLFVEYNYNWVDDFGSGSSFDLSDDGFYFGLAFEM